MKTLKKLLLATLLLCSSSSFANTGEGGFDDPVKLFNFYIDLAEKAMKYRQKHGDYNSVHIKKLAPHVWSERKKYELSARHKLSGHESYVRRSKRGSHPFIVDLNRQKTYIYKNIFYASYTYYKYQQQPRYDFPNLFQARPKKVGNKIKWYVY